MAVIKKSSTTIAQIEPKPRASEVVVRKESTSAKNMIVAAAKNPKGGSPPSHESSPKDSPVEAGQEKKPQFYFGQTMADLVRQSSLQNGNQTAIDKVKQNEALTHPKRAEVNVSAELSKKSTRHTSIITVSNPKLAENSGKKASSLSSGVSSLSSSSSASSSRSSPAKENTPSPPPPPAMSSMSSLAKAPMRPAEPTQDSIRKAFEAQLLAGKSRLKKVEDEVGVMAKLPPAPVPPPPTPPAPPSMEALKNGINNSRSSALLRSYEIPQAPKLNPKLKPKEISKKGLVAPNGVSAREELMMAIRGTGGFQGLRKASSGPLC